jgi:hypothetical protein
MNQKLIYILYYKISMRVPDPQLWGQVSLSESSIHFYGSKYLTCSYEVRWVWVSPLYISMAVPDPQLWGQVSLSESSIHFYGSTWPAAMRSGESESLSEPSIHFYDSKYLTRSYEARWVRVSPQYISMTVSTSPAAMRSGESEWVLYTFLWQ